MGPFFFGICSQAVVLDHAVKTKQQRTTRLCPVSRGRPQACWTKKKNLSLCEEEVLEVLLCTAEIRQQCLVEPCTSTVPTG